MPWSRQLRRTHRQAALRYGERDVGEQRLASRRAERRPLEAMRAIVRQGRLLGVGELVRRGLDIVAVALFGRTQEGLRQTSARPHCKRGRRTSMRPNELMDASRRGRKIEKVW
jgi:hypothetical protein